jgi:hypothetical protein
MRRKRIGIFTWSDPFRLHTGRSWYHHDAILRSIDATYIILNPLLKYSDAQDRSKIIEGLQGLDIEFSDTVDNRSIDCAIIEPFYARSVRRSNGTIYSSLEVESDLVRLIERLYRDRKYIMWYDSEGYFTEKYPRSNRHNHDVELGHRLLSVIDMSYNNQGFVTPMSKHPMLPKFKCSEYVPFNIDRKQLPSSIEKLSGRERLLTYVGNDYRRSHILPVLYHASEIGLTRLIGGGWKLANGTLIDYKGSLELDSHSVLNEYRQSAVGLFTSPPDWVEYGHRTLRIRELVCSGTLVIPEEHLYDHCGIDEIHTRSPMLSDYLYEVENEMSDNEYESKVRLQRDLIMSHYDSAMYVSTYKKFLGLV